MPRGYTPQSFLERLCREAAIRRYGGLLAQVESRLAEEFRLIERLNLAGFLLLYREIALLAQRTMEERGLTSPETPVEERPPGRGRGSSVALLVGYLIGISHVDPLKWDLTLERFISEDMTTLPDIDLDFPRGLRDELIERVHRHFGPEYAVLTGAVTTYKVKGIIQDLGKALRPPPGAPVPALETAPLPRRRGPAEGDGATARLQRQDGRAGLAGPDRPGPAADERSEGSGPARRRGGAQQLAHTGDGPNDGKEPSPAATSWTGTRTAWPTRASPRSTSSRCPCSTR